MKFINKIADWIVAKPHRYWISQYLLQTVVFFCACLTVAIFFILFSK